MRCPGGGEGGRPQGGGYLAFFARKRFELADSSSVRSATLSVSYDDGFVAYVNGVEVGRVNMPSGEITESTAATDTVGNAPEEPDAVITIPTDLLLDGANVIAASVHNRSLASSDASFIPTLETLSVESKALEDDFLRGDVDGNGVHEITDVLRAFNFLFLGGPPPACHDAVDTNDDGDINITDGILLLNVLFLGRGEVAAPGILECGADPTSDDPLPACRYEACP